MFFHLWDKLYQKQLVKGKKMNQIKKYILEHPIFMFNLSVCLSITSFIVYILYVEDVPMHHLSLEVLIGYFFTCLILLYLFVTKTNNKKWLFITSLIAPFILFVSINNTTIDNNKERTIGMHNVSIVELEDKWIDIETIKKYINEYEMLPSINYLKTNELISFIEIVNKNIESGELHQLTKTLETSFIIPTPYKMKEKTVINTYQNSFLGKIEKLVFSLRRAMQRETLFHENDTLNITLNKELEICLDNDAYSFTKNQMSIFLDKYAESDKEDIIKELNANIKDDTHHENGFKSIHLVSNPNKDITRELYLLDKCKEFSRKVDNVSKNISSIELKVDNIKLIQTFSILTN
jgi:hypothetical protein